MGELDPRLHRRSAGHSPPRILGSVRRTSTIDVIWDSIKAREQAARYVGRARDLLTPAGGGAPQVLAEDALLATLERDRLIRAIEAIPPRPALAVLVGQRSGGGTRKLMREAVPEEVERSTPLHLLLDDLAGASLVSGWAWSQWDPEWLFAIRDPAAAAKMAHAFKDRAGICAGFAPGSSGLDMHTDRSGTPTVDLRDPADPEGWH